MEDPRTLGYLKALHSGICRLRRNTSYRFRGNNNHRILDLAEYNIVD